MGIERIGLPVTVEGHAAFDPDTDFVAHSNESRIVQRWIFGVSYQG